MVRRAGRRQLRQRLQGRVGDVHPPLVRRRPVQVDVARRRQGRAACGSGAEELEGAPLDRRSGAEGLTMPTLNLPVSGGKIAAYTMQPPKKFPAAKPPFNRIAYAAAHVVPNPLADSNPWLDSSI